MDQELQLTRAWEHATTACSHLAGTVQALGNPDAAPDHKTRGEALMALGEARTALNAASSLLDQQIDRLATSLQTTR